MRCRLSSALGLSLGAALSIAMGGCAHPETVADRQFAEMREQVSRMEAETDKMERRLGALEGVTADDKNPPAANAAAAGTGTGTGTLPVSPRRVVQLGEPSEADPADP